MIRVIVTRMFDDGQRRHTDARTVYLLDIAELHAFVDRFDHPTVTIEVDGVQ